MLLPARLRAAVDQLNPKVLQAARDEAVRKVLVQEHPALVQENRRNHKLLVEGVEVEYLRAVGSMGDRVRLLDFDDPEDNDWLAVNQFTVVEDQHNRRPDVVVFVNGLPLAVLELKNAADENADDLDGLQPAPDLQAADPVAVRVQRSCWSSPTALEARIGSLTRRPGAVHALAHDRRARRSRRRADCPSWRSLLEGVFEQAAVPRPAPRLHRLRGRRRGDVVKKLAGYHQFHARADTARVRAATRRRPSPAGGAATGGSAWSGTRRARARA